MYFYVTHRVCTSPGCEAAAAEEEAGAVAVAVTSTTERHSRRRNASQKRSRQGTSARRYQPRTGGGACPHECGASSDGAAAVNATDRRLTLLLLGNVLNVGHRDKLRKCAVGRRLDGFDAVDRLGAMLEAETLAAPTQYVVHISAKNWVHADPDRVSESVIDVVDKMVELLGGVSVYGSDRGVTPRSGASAQAVRATVFEYCRFKQRRCRTLEDLQVLQRRAPRHLGFRHPKTFQRGRPLEIEDQKSTETKMSCCFYLCFEFFCFGICQMIEIAAYFVATLQSFCFKFTVGYWYQ
jgi:hypothetical protein